MLPGPTPSLPFPVWWRRRSPRSGIVKRRCSATVDQYAGVRVLPRVPELSGAVDAKRFFKRFVATRTPVIVRGGVQRETMAVLADDAALEAAAGDCQLQVEVRAGAESFGRGNKRRMRFGALLRKAAAHVHVLAESRPRPPACAPHVPEPQGRSLHCRAWHAAHLPTRTSGASMRKMSPQRQELLLPNSPQTGHYWRLRLRRARRGST